MSLLRLLAGEPDARAQRGQAGAGPATRRCAAPGCRGATRELKPYCPEHVLAHPYAADLARQAEAGQHLEGDLWAVLYEAHLRGAPVSRSWLLGYTPKLGYPEVRVRWLVSRLVREGRVREAPPVSDRGGPRLELDLGAWPDPTPAQQEEPMSAPPAANPLTNRRRPPCASCREERPGSRTEGRCGRCHQRLKKGGPVCGCGYVAPQRGEGKFWCPFCELDLRPPEPEPAPEVPAATSSRPTPCGCDEARLLRALAAACRAAADVFEEVARG